MADYYRVVPCYLQVYCSALVATVLAKFQIYTVGHKKRAALFTTMFPSRFLYFFTVGKTNEYSTVTYNLLTCHVILHVNAAKNWFANCHVLSR